MAFSAWRPPPWAGHLEPAGAARQEVLGGTGPAGPGTDYLAKPHGKWVVVPGVRGTLCLTACSRIDLMREHGGVDLLAMFPGGAEPTKAAEQWTWQAFLEAADKCHKAGYAFGLPLGGTTDSVEWR